jgi:NAD(P)-dependent dehydrogenase (short-subunit alcohol dehydrogenase family)
VRVHLKDHFCTIHYASIHMRERKSGRIISFSSNTAAFGAQGIPTTPRPRPESWD